MLRWRLRRRRSALLRLCASDSPVPHTKGLPLPTFCRFSALELLPSPLLGLWGDPGCIPRAVWPLGHPPLPGQTSPNFPQTPQAGEGPWPEARMRPAGCSAFPGFRRAGVESDECPRGPPSPCSQGHPGLRCCLSSLEAGSGSPTPCSPQFCYLCAWKSPRGAPGSSEQGGERTARRRPGDGTPGFLGGGPGQLRPAAGREALGRPPAEGPVTRGAGCGELVFASGLRRQR